MDTNGNLKKYKLAIFDFDGTLISTPLPDEGRVAYKEKTGKDWQHKGWWSKPESLDQTLFDMPEVRSTIKAYHEEKSKAGVLIMMVY